MKFYIAVLIILSLAGTMNKAQTINQKEKNAGRGLQLNWIDDSVKPAVDFFAYANGNWLKNNPIPPSESYWGIFSSLQEDNYKSLLTVMKEDAKKKAPEGSNIQKVGDFYFSGMDTVRINRQGAEPLNKEFSRINKIKDLKDLNSVIALYQTYGVSPLFNFFAMQDQMNSSKIVPYLYQGGIAMPDRDYYLKTDSASIEIRNKYIEHITNMFKLLGDDAQLSKKEANIVMNIETNLAKSSMTPVEQRDPYAIYHKYSIESADSLTPTIKWKLFLKEAGIKKSDYIIISQPEFFKEVNNLLKSESIDNWKVYLRWCLINNFAPYLSNYFVDENFRFFGTVLTGAKELKPRWKRILQDADQAIGEILGQEFVRLHFPPAAKKSNIDIVDNLIKVFGERIEKLDWMSKATKEKAIYKLHKILKKVGYPDKWRDYSGLKIDRGAYVDNIIRANIFNFKYMTDKIGKPVDKTLWEMTPQTVNAYYDPSLNEIVFPAGILQPPFFDLNADDAVNYGETGATIGHEMTHGFDDQGRQYDASGNLKNWWSSNDEKKFKSRTEKIVQQFNDYVVLDSLHVNGELTLGENIADLGGLVIAYDAFKLTKEGRSNKKIDGFTPDQRFFIAYAQSWAGHERNEALKKQILTNPHSPDKLRANGPLSNMPEFYKAFNVKPGDPMYRPDSLRVKIW